MFKGCVLVSLIVAAFKKVLKYVLNLNADASVSAVPIRNGSVRHVTRNSLGQRSFLGIRALRETIIYNTREKGPAGKTLWLFLLKTLKN